MKYYLKKISKQDKTRTFVVNRQAINNYFNLKLYKKNDEDYINIIYPDSNKIENIRVILKQDPRFLIKKHFFNIDDIIVFEKKYDSKKDLRYYKVAVINPWKDNYKEMCRLLKKNYIITDRIEINIYESSNVSKNEPIKVIVNVKKN